MCVVLTIRRRPYGWALQRKHFPERVHDLKYDMPLRAREAAAAQVGEREGVYEALMGVSIPEGSSPSLLFLAMIYIAKMCVT